jgi:hypothetical protein
MKYFLIRQMWAPTAGPITRASGYLSTVARDATRIPTGHPEGYLETFAAIYYGAVEAIRNSIQFRNLAHLAYFQVSGSVVKITDVRLDEGTK